MNINKTPTVLFDASVVISGLYSPEGGSGKLLEWARNDVIRAIISETIMDEIIRNTDILKVKESKLVKALEDYFIIYEAPNERLVNKYKRVVIDYGDAHVLASYRETKSDYLVSLDKKHILVLKGKIKDMKIVSPGDLIEKLRFS